MYEAEKEALGIKTTKDKGVGSPAVGSDSCIHILRNPYGFSKAEIKAAQLKACNEIELWKEAYLNMKEWAKENGVDIMAYYP
jgi:hypothetical protein